MDKPFILDPCCGSKMFYHDKESDAVMFCDIRGGIKRGSEFKRCCRNGFTYIKFRINGSPNTGEVKEKAAKKEAPCKSQVQKA